MRTEPSTEKPPPCSHCAIACAASAGSRPRRTKTRNSRRRTDCCTWAIALASAQVDKASCFVRPHLDAAGITGDFDTVIGGDDAPRKKPHPDPMFLAAQRLDVTSQRMLMVGDSGNDVAAARAAGCPVLVVPYGYSEGAPVQSLGADGIVDSLLALGNCIRRPR